MVKVPAHLFQRHQLNGSHQNVKIENMLLENFEKVDPPLQKYEPFKYLEANILEGISPGPFEVVLMVWNCKHYNKLSAKDMEFKLFLKNIGT